MNGKPEHNNPLLASYLHGSNPEPAVEQPVSLHFGISDREVLVRHITILEMALESSPNGIMITDEHSHLVFYNQNLLHLLSMGGNALQGDGWKETISRHSRNAARFLSFAEQIIQEHIGETLDIFEWADGRLLECSTHYQYIDSLASHFCLWSFTDCTEQQRRERELTHLGTHDTLTGIHNRAYFDIQLRQARLSKSYPICMFMIDMDGLKNINDHRGHAAGDTLLRRVASLLGQACRTDDIVARIGGDEFGLLLVKADTDTAEQVAGRIQGLLNLYNIRHPDAPVSLSMGFAVARDHKEMEDLFARADGTMYEARRKRRAETREPG